MSAMLITSVWGVNQMIFYSPTTCGFYESGRNAVIPDDAIEVTAEERNELLAGQSGEKLIGVGGDGRPLLLDRPGPTPEKLAELERRWRDSELSLAASMRDRHRDQLEIEVETTLAGEQFAELLRYMQALRDWPQSPDFPDSQHRPAAPPWIDGQAQ